MRVVWRGRAQALVALAGWVIAMGARGAAPAAAQPALQPAAQPAAQPAIHPAPQPAPPIDLGQFHNASRWQASASDQVQSRLAPDGLGALCLHYDFGAVSGYAVARLAWPQDAPLLLPAHYALRLKLHGEGASNALQLKLVDASGDNVWWRQWPAFVPAAASTTLKIAQRQIEFAWGPATDRRLTQAAALELVVASGAGGGAGRLCFEQLSLWPLAAPGPAPAPRIRRTASATTVDLGRVQEINGLQWQWAGTDTAAASRTGPSPSVASPSAANPSAASVQLSDDGSRWRALRRWPAGAPAAPLLWLPGTEARFIRIQSRRAVTALRWPGPAEWPDRNALLKSLAASLPRHAMPRAWHGQQNYWTIVGVDGGGARAALIDEDGAIEPQRGGPSLVPMLIDGQGRRIGWSDVGIRHSLRDGYLPLPTVEWTHPRAGLKVEAVADGSPAQARLIARYTVTNPSPQRQRLTLALQLRPWQVNPPQQFLNTPGGEAAVRQLAWQGSELRVNGRPWLTALQPPAGVRAVGFEGGDVLGVWAAEEVEAKRVGREPNLRPDLRAVLVGTPRKAGTKWDSSPPVAADLVLPPRLLGPTAHRWGAASGTPARRSPALGAAAPQSLSIDLTDPEAAASASLQWPLDLAPGERATVHLLLPLAGQPAPLLDAAAADARIDAVATAWAQRLNRVGLSLPAAAQPLHHSLRSALSHILMSRDGPALQPGTRSYARSWIRDGAMMVAGLLRLGEIDAARDFVDWYAGKLFASGKVPCCVDARGADPVAENDSHGQFIFAVAEVWRYTGDNAWLASRWPQVDAAVRYQAGLSQSERSDANRLPARQAFFGMMPASISHEGYSAQPMHSFWDNFWALAGWRDAARLARALGQVARADALDEEHGRFRSELQASLAATMAQHAIPHLPGAAELGDFDPSSSTLIFSPAGAEHLVPQAALDATWQRYWDEAQRRMPGSPNAGSDWLDYTPYELRSVSALLRLGHADRTLAMLDFFHRDQRPAGWNHWAEVVGRLPREPRFIGDMPHAWISSDYIRSALDLLAFERDSDQALVLAAGVPIDWLRSGPVAVQGLGTSFGKLTYRLALAGNHLQLTLGGRLSEPPGGLWLQWQGRLHRVPAGATAWALPLGDQP